MAHNIFYNDIQFAQVVNIAEGEDAILIGGVVVRLHPDSQRHVHNLVAAIRSALYPDVSKGWKTEGALVGVAQPKINIANSGKAGCAQSVVEKYPPDQWPDYMLDYGERNG